MPPAVIQRHRVQAAVNSKHALIIQKGEQPFSLEHAGSASFSNVTTSSANARLCSSKIQRVVLSDSSAFVRKPLRAGRRPPTLWQNLKNQAETLISRKKEENLSSISEDSSACAGCDNRCGRFNSSYIEVSSAVEVSQSALS